MLYCCGSKEKGEREHAGLKKEDKEEEEGEEEALRNSRKPQSPRNAPVTGMYETADMPELLPPCSTFGHTDRDPRLMRLTHAETTRDSFRLHDLPEGPQRRGGQRAPKLGQIGRSKRVVIEDEDLDDVLNNNDIQRAVVSSMGHPVSVALLADGCTTQDYMHTDRYHDCP
ncbi:hypothetical protein NFI96_023470 [Prochilodus magdalenae]|nr:hypothetical protein NFI96_023470 [Prochilodus magdalenae]